MKNQFFYTRIVRTPGGEEGTVIERMFRDSFNLEKVIRSVTLETGEVIVLLDDVHEQIQQMPVMGKNGKPTSYKEIRTMVQSEITLTPEDGQRFYLVTDGSENYTNYNEGPHLISSGTTPQMSIATETEN